MPKETAEWCFFVPDCLRVNLMNWPFMILYRECFSFVPQSILNLLINELFREKPNMNSYACLRNQSAHEMVD